MDILFFIIFPIATILIAIVLQKLFKSPLLVAIFVFTIFFILTYTVYTPEFLLNTIIYTIIAFLAAVIFKLLCCIRKKINCNIFSICNDNEIELEARVTSLENSLEMIEKDIRNINCLISAAINNGNTNSGCNNNCCCNRRLKR